MRPNKNGGENGGSSMNEVKRASGPRLAQVDPPVPHSVETELAILGAFLVGTPDIDKAFALDGEDFFDQRNRLVFDALRTLHHESKPTYDLIVLISALEASGKIEAVGREYVACIGDGCAKVNPSISRYMHQLRSLSLRRRAMAIGERASAPNGERALAEVATLAQRIAAPLTPDPLAAEPAGWRDVFHSYSDFENAPPLSFSINGFLQNNGATMIGGLSGHSKTFINLSIAKALLAGKGARLWDLFDVMENAVRVVYLIPECAIEPFKHRLRLFGLYKYLAPDDERLLVRTLSKGPAPDLSDPCVLFAVKGAHVFLDTASRFADGEENSASDNQRGLASDIFALLASGARSVVAAHHSPKPFAKENVMRLENVLRGSGDVGAMLTTAWGVKQLDGDQNIVHIENIKPRDFQPCGAFQLIGRPWIDEEGDFRLHKRPGECGTLMEEQDPERNQGGATIESRMERQRRVGLVRDWLAEDENQTIEQLRVRLENAGIKVGPTAVKNYRREAIQDQ
jgi:hypothetical protein